MAFVYALDPTAPANTDLVKDGAGDIRLVKNALIERIESFIQDVDNDPWQVKAGATFLGGLTQIAGTAALQAVTTTTVVASGLVTANAGLTVVGTLTVTGVTVTGLTAASVGAGTFPVGAFVFQGAVSGITTLGTTSTVTISGVGSNLSLGGALLLASVGTTSSTPGSIVKNAARGFVINAITGSAQDFTINTPAGALLLYNDTGTNNITFTGAVSGITTLAGTGAVSGFTSANFSTTGTFGTGLTVTAGTSALQAVTGTTAVFSSTGRFGSGGAPVTAGILTVDSGGVSGTLPLSVEGGTANSAIAKFFRGGSEKPLYIAAAQNTESIIASEGAIWLSPSVTADDPFMSGASTFKLTTASLTLASIAVTGITTLTVATSATIGAGSTAADLTLNGSTTGGNGTRFIMQTGSTNRWTISYNYASTGRLEFYELAAGSLGFSVLDTTHGMVLTGPLSGVTSITQASGTAALQAVTATTITATSTITSTLGSIAASTPAFNNTVTWNNAAVTFTHELHTITDTASNAASILLRYTVGGTNVFTLTKAGVLNNLGGVNLSSGNISIVSAGNIQISNADNSTTALISNSGGAGVNTLALTATTIAVVGNLTVSGSFTSADTTFHRTSAALANSAAAAVATMTNGPTAGNPTKWVAVNDNGTTRYLPLW